MEGNACCDLQGALNEVRLALLDTPVPVLYLHATCITEYAAMPVQHTLACMAHPGGAGILVHGTTGGTRAFLAHMAATRISQATYELRNAAGCLKHMWVAWLPVCRLHRGQRSVWKGMHAVTYREL